jgi:hypothetical protein
MRRCEGGAENGPASVRTTNRSARYTPSLLLEQQQGEVAEVKTGSPRSLAGRTRYTGAGPRGEQEPALGVYMLQPAGPTSAEARVEWWVGPLPSRKGKRFAGRTTPRAPRSGVWGTWGCL